MPKLILRVVNDRVTRLSPSAVKPVKRGPVRRRTGDDAVVILVAHRPRAALTVVDPQDAADRECSLNGLRNGPRYGVRLAKFGGSCPQSRKLFPVRRDKGLVVQTAVFVRHPGGRTRGASPAPALEPTVTLDKCWRSPENAEFWTCRS
jgi:hypothetical protein